MSNPPTPEMPETGGSAETPEQGQQPAPPRYYAPPQYAQPQQPQYAPPQYGAPQQPQYAQPQYAQPQQPQYAYPPQYSTALPAPGPGEPFDGARHPGELSRPLYGASMGQAFTRFFRNYANFSGRASRSEYWWMALTFACAYIGLALIGAIFSGLARQAMPYGYGGANLIAGFLGIILILAFLGIIVPSLALAWRRLHDANLAGPLYLLVLIPYAGSLVILIFTLLSPKPEGRRFDRPVR